jgi:hypothetical protein
MASYEVNDRYNILVGQPSAHPVIANQLPTSQTVGFHPIGFPGRYSRIETTVIIIDDCWRSSADRPSGVAASPLTAAVTLSSRICNR